MTVSVPRTKSAPKARAEGCRHCGLPVPSDTPALGFCCRGCATVFELLAGEGLDRFYELGGGMGQPVGAAPSVPQFPWADELVARSEIGPDRARVRLDVQGVRCAACVWVLQELWQRQPGAMVIDLDPALGQVSLAFDTSRLDLQSYLAVAASLGYRMAPASKEPRRQDRGLLVRLGICASLAMNAMILAVAGYAGLDEEGGLLAEVFGWVSAGIAVGAVLVGGPVFFRGASQGLRHRVLHLDLPISLGILAAFGGSTWAFATGHPAYFDTVTIFVALMLAGRFVQERAISRNRDQLLADDGSEHLRSRRIRQGVVEPVPVDDVEVGDTLLLAPGDLVPVASTLASSDASFSLDWINGEAEPRTFSAGAKVPAGAFYGGLSPVRVVATQTYGDSHLRELLAAPVEDRDERGQRGRFWTRVNRIYVAFVLLAAALGVALWWSTGVEAAISVGVAVLVVTCPCALGLALPLGFHLSLARLRRDGVFVRTSSLLEKARHLRHVLFDKTGTLTWGGLRARSVIAPEGEDLKVLASMAAVSNHPASRAVTDWLGSNGQASLVLDEVEVVERPGEGLEASLGGQVWRLGRGGFAGPDEPGLWFCRGGDVGCEVVGRFELEEDDRDGVDREIAWLESLGLEVRMISGDRPERVRDAAERFGIASERAVGGLRPEDKAALVRDLDDRDTLMVGDGINDAPAFEAAFCAGTPALDRPVLPGRADFFYAGAQAGAVGAVVTAARGLHRTVVTNLVLAGVYNFVALGLSLAGWMTPLLCAVLMPLSSLVLLGHTGARLAPRTPAVGGMPSVPRGDLP